MLTRDEIESVRVKYVRKTMEASSLVELAAVRREFMKWYNEAMRAVFKPAEK